MGDLTNKFFSFSNKLTVSVGGGSSIASGVASIAVASIGGGDDCGRGRGQTSENSDLQ